MKLLMESWRKFLNERMEFGEGFERWIHGEPEEEPTRGPMSMDVDDDEFGQAPHCKPQSIDPECLEEYGFEKIGEGMNKQEADKFAQTGYPDLLPKVYDTAKDYSWIVVERVKPYGFSSDKWIYDFFPIFVKFWKANQDNVDFEWRNTSLEDFFGEYTESRRNEIREPANSNLTHELGGEKTREELESQLPPLYKRFLEFIEQYGVEPIEIRGDNVGKAADGRFVILDSGWDSDSLEEKRG